jgi:TRAP-type C4-dicarboxylate transport system permease small subunit
MTSKILIKFCDMAALFGAVLAGLSLVLMIGLGLVEIFMREVLGRGLSISLEYTGYLVGYAFLMGSGWAFRQGKHIRLNLLPFKVFQSKPFEKLLHWAAIIILSILVVGLTTWVAGSFFRESVSFFPSATPLWVPQALFALGPAILMFSIFSSLVELGEEKPK